MDFVSNPYNFSLIKDKTGRCLCYDEDFKNKYKEKWEN